MNHWKRLELEPTNDSRLIKQAYAAKLKECHPEDDPEGFMQLQAAYQWALQQAEQPVLVSRKAPQTEPVAPSNRHFSGPPEQQEEAPVTPAAQFMALLEGLCADGERRQDPAAWQELLQGDIKWPLDIAPLVQARVMALLKATAPLPCEAWYGCNDLFGWAEPENLAHLFTNEELIELFGKHGDARISLQVSKALSEQGKEYAVHGNAQAAMACYEKILDWFAGSDVPEVQQEAACTASSLLLDLERISDEQAIVQAKEELILFVNRTDDRARCHLVQSLHDKTGFEKPQDDIAVYNLIRSLFAADRHPQVCETVVSSMFKLAIEYREQERVDESIAVSEETIQRFLDNPNEKIHVCIAWMLFLLSFEYVLLGRFQEVLATLHCLISKFGDSANPEIRAQVAEALLYKAVYCQRLGQKEEAGAVYQQALQMFLGSDDEEVCNQIIRMMVTQGFYQSRLGKIQDAFLAVSRLISKLSGSDGAAIREQKARNFYRQELGVHEETPPAIKQMRGLVAADSQEKICEGIIAVLLATSFADQHQTQLAVAIDGCKQAVYHFMDKDDEDMCMQVAHILFNKNRYESLLARTQEALAELNRLISGNADIRVQVAQALHHQAAGGERSVQTEELGQAIAACNQALQQLLDSGTEEHGVQEAKLFPDQPGWCKKLGLTEAVLAVYEQAFRLLINGGNEKIHGQVALSLLYQGNACLEQGNTPAALAAYDQLLSRFAGSTQEDIQNAVATARENKSQLEASKATVPSTANIWQKAVLLLKKWL